MLVNFRVVFPFIVCCLFIKQCESTDSGLYTAENQTRAFSQLSSEEQQKPVKSRSPVECILKCRIKLMDSFYVSDSDDEHNCYCIVKKKNNNNKENTDLSSVTKNGDMANGIFFNEHKVYIYSNHLPKHSPP